MALLYTQTTGSSAIRKVGYNTLTDELHIEFEKRKKYPEYIWGGVPEDLVTNFLRAGSKGSFYHAHIKGKSSFKVKKAIGSYRLGAIGRRIRNVFSPKR